MSPEDNVPETSPIDFSATSEGKLPENTFLPPEGAIEGEPGDAGIPEVEAEVLGGVTDAPEQGLVPETTADHTAPDTIEVLQARQAEIAAKIAEQQNAAKTSVLAQIKRVVTEYNLTVAEVVEALGGLKNSRKGTKAKAKYKDDQGNTWSGRGKQPKWMNGADPQKFLIVE